MNNGFLNTINWGALITGAVGGLLSGSLVPALLQHIRWARERKDKRAIETAVYDPNEKLLEGSIRDQISKLDLLPKEKIKDAVKKMRENLRDLTLEGVLSRETYDALLKEIDKTGF